MHSPRVSSCCLDQFYQSLDVDELDGLVHRDRQVSPQRFVTTARMTCAVYRVAVDAAVRYHLVP